VVASIWPEPRSTAAGYRLTQFVAHARKLRPKCEVIVTSPAPLNDHARELERDLHVRVAFTPANHFSIGESCRVDGIKVDEESHVGEMQRILRSFKPEVVLFERFFMEEMFGWMVEAEAPSALRVLDTQDLHFVRRARHAALEECERQDPSTTAILNAVSTSVHDFMDHAELVRPHVLREIGSILRSDLTFVVSNFEYKLLREKFNVPQSRLAMLSLLYSDAPVCTTLTKFGARQGFSSIGNFLHAPNRDAVAFLVRHIWKPLRAATVERLMRPHTTKLDIGSTSDVGAPRSILKSVQLHIYGAYCGPQDYALHDPSIGVFVHGHARDQFEVLSKHRVLLAPIRFGAGVKGKIADAWQTGTPVIASEIAAESMINNQGAFGGQVAQTKEDFVCMASKLFVDPYKWSSCASTGHKFTNAQHNGERNVSKALASMEAALSELEKRRRTDWFGSVLRFGQHRHNEIFARYVQVSKTAALLRKTTRSLSTTSDTSRSHTLPIT